MRKAYAGVTPIENMRVIRGGYKAFFAKEGYMPAERVFSSGYGIEGEARSPEVSIDVNLLKLDRMLKNMVIVPGGKYQLVGWDAPTNAEAELNDYYIDKYEVSNRNDRDTAY